MKRMLAKFQNMAMAAAYAEAGEWDTARGFLPEVRPNTLLTWLEDHFSAVAFAEADLPEEAVRIIGGRSLCRPSGQDIYESLGLKGVHLSFGYMTVN